MKILLTVTIKITKPTTKTTDLALVDGEVDAPQNLLPSLGDHGLQSPHLQQRLPRLAGACLNGGGRDGGVGRDGGGWWPEAEAERGWGDGGEGAARERRGGGGADVGEGHGWLVGWSVARSVGHSSQSGRVEI